MSLPTFLRSRVLLFILAVVVTARLLLYLTDYQGRITSARSLLSEWNLAQAEQQLRSLAHDYPRSIETRRMYADCLLKRGELRNARSEFTALVALDTSETLLHTVSLATVHFFLGGLDTAYSLARSVIVKASENSVAQGRALHLLGRIAFNRAQYDSALVFQCNTLALARASGSEQLEADALRQIGVLSWYNGKADSARISYYEPALVLYRRINDRAGEATTLNNLGLLRGDMKCYLEAFAIRRKIGDQIGLADSYYFVTSGSASHWFDLMYSFRKKSLELSRRIGYAWGKDVAARAVEDMVVSAYDSLQFDPQVADPNSNSPGEQIIQHMQRRSSELARERKWKEAAALHERIIALSDSMGYSIGLGQSLGHYIGALLPLGEYKKAESLARRLQKLSPDDPMGAGCTFAEVYLASGQYRPAAELLRTLTTQLDETYLSRLRQKGVSFPLESAGMLTRRFHLYSMLVAALKHQGSVEEIFSAFERFRALPLGFALEPGEGSIEGTDESIWHRYVRTLEEMENNPDEIERLVTEFNEAYRSTLEHSAAASIASTVIYGRAPPGLSEVQHALTDRQVVIEFFMGNEEAYAFALRRDKSLFLRLTESASNINSSVRSFRDLLLRGRASPADGLWRGPAAFLFCTLIQPIIERGFLHEGDHLIISPHGRLHDVPFACLVDSNGLTLVKRFTVSYVPSASILLTHRSNHHPLTFVAFVPDRRSLPFSEKEVAGIPSSLFASHNVQLDDQASASELIQRARGADIVHIAAHGSMHRWHPLFSYLRLSDGPFQLYRILDLRLLTQLVVLSACETGYGVGMMGDIAQGHEVVSFPRAFLFAGASCVIAPLWVVEDEATSHLMTSFYANLASLHRTEGSFDGASFAQALTLAQRQLVEEPDRSRSQSHPFYWAGFYVTGSTD